jgi:putative ABC transport system permease protein
VEFGLVRKALGTRRARAALAVAGVAVSTVLVLVLFGISRSLELGVEGYVGQPSSDLWVAPRGTDNLIRSGGFLPAAWQEKVRSVSGVDAVDPVIRTFVTVEAHEPGRDRRLTLLALAYRAPSGLGGPPSLVSGRAPGGRGEVALDRAAAFRLGVNAGDTVLVNGERMRVVCLTRRTNLLATQFLFADLNGLAAASGAPDLASFLVVRLARPEDSALVARRIEERLPRASLYSRQTFLENNLREVSAGFTPLLVLVTVVGIAASATVVGLLAHGLAEDRRSDIAVLFALGARRGLVCRGLIARVETLVLLGIFSGMLLALALGAALDRVLPTIELTYRGSDLAFSLVLFCLSGLLAALAPVLRLRRIDPLEAFRP